MSEDFDFDKLKEDLDLELKKAKEYVEEKKKITPKPVENKKLTTLSDEEELSILSALHVKEDVLEILTIRPGAWAPEISRLTLEVAALEFRLEKYKIKE
jgi:hypothetical protein